MNRQYGPYSGRKNKMTNMDLVLFLEHRRVQNMQFTLSLIVNSFFNYFTYNLIMDISPPSFSSRKCNFFFKNEGRKELNCII